MVQDLDGLAVAFDIDGTLVQILPEEELLFGRACAEVLGRAVPRLSWSEFPVVTDAGIVQSVWAQVAGRAPIPGEIEAVRDRHCAGLEALLRQDPGRIQAIPGARAILLRLRSRAGWATGNSAPAARLKLAAAGLLDLDLPLASAEDGPERTAIVLRCGQLLGLRPGQRLVSVGDGTWDVQAARDLGLPFVGIASVPGRAERLRAAGASAILPDLSDLGAVLRALRTAPVPA